MEMQHTPGVSGTSVTIPECRKCEKKKARGVMMTREMDGAVIFKCDYCGLKSKYGHDESFAVLIDKEAEDYQRSIANRERYRRETDERFNHVYAESLEEFKHVPDPVKNFYNTEKPHFDSFAKGIQED